MAQRVPLPDEGQAEEMRTWVNERCCAIMEAGWALLQQGVSTSQHPVLWSGLRPPTYLHGLDF